MGKDSFEHLMGMHGAPFLTGMRPAFLLSFRKDKFEDFDAMLDAYLPCLQCKGIDVKPLVERVDYVLLLFYRREALTRTLEQPGVQNLLRQSGYPSEGSLEDHLAELKRRLRQRLTFPHEIGLFLGYPAADVRGFIEHHGQDFRYCGYWKVYVNEAETRALFDRYTSCTQEFCEQLAAGAAFPELVRAV